MQIKSLKVQDYKCLCDFDINFSTNDSGSSTILIGENGTGKTTTLEAILNIMASFDSPKIEKDLASDYELVYEFGGETICITKSNHRYKITVDDEIICTGRINEIKEYLNNYKRIFPQRIIAFYSGANDKFKNIIKRVNFNYAKDCRKVITEFLKSMSDETAIISPLHKRKYNYCDEDLTPIYLCSILGGNDTFEKKYLKEKCHFDNIDYINMVINVDKVESIFGRDRFNGDIPTGLYYLSDFLDYRFTDILRRGFIYSSIGKSYFDIKGLADLGVDTISIFEYFEKLHTLFDAQYEVYISKGTESIKCGDMSEGQRQLIKMLGMLGVCKKEDCLVLMDEPDAHMNPLWKYEIKETIDKSLELATNSQALIATHDPLVINGVDKEFIRIYTINEHRRSNNGLYITEVVSPTEDTAGMGIDGLLQSEYYGLPSVLDTNTKKKMDKKHELMVKESEGIISDNELQELNRLTEELENMTFSRNIPTDRYYDEYIAAMHKIYLDKKDVKLSRDDINERNAKAEEILRELLKK